MKQDIFSEKTPPRVFNKNNIFNKTVTVQCLQSLEELKKTAKLLNLKFIMNSIEKFETNSILSESDTSECDQFSSQLRNRRDMKVEMILSHKVSKKRGRQYLVKWKGYNSKYSTWERRTNLTGCEKLIYFYDTLRDPPPCLNERIVYYFITDLTTRVPYDILTLKKLCALVYGLTEEYITGLGINDYELIKKVSRIVEISIEELNKMSDELFKLMHLAEARKNILMNLQEWEDEINAVSVPPIKVENNVDLEEAPKGFKFISVNINPFINFSIKPKHFCKCDNCYTNRDFCCPKKFDELFAYNKAKQLQLSEGYAIYECNYLCKCSQDCVNRVVQQNSKVKLAIFRTANGCGWGLKTLDVIQKNQYIIEYLGEVVTSEEAEVRGKLYDYLGLSYLFDLDFEGKSMYTIDGGRYGNASHYINHSCSPNMHVFSVWINHSDPNLPRLAFFSKRKIKPGEELTFDYKMVDTRQKKGDIIPDEERVLCKCNSKNCRKYLF